MFIAMNRFSIAPAHEKDFEDIWKGRQSFLDDVPGFREFHLLKGPSEEAATLYASHTIWETQDAFEAWTQSEAFQKAHGRARAPEGTYLGPPQFEGFQVVL